MQWLTSLSLQIYVIKHSPLHSRCAADIFSFFYPVNQLSEFPVPFAHWYAVNLQILPPNQWFAIKRAAKKTCREMGKRERGGGTQSCRITCKFSTSPSIGCHGTSFDQKLTAQQYTEAFINVRRCRMQRCHWQMPSLSRSVYLSPFPSVPRWQHNKSSVNWFQNFNGKKGNARTHMLP